MNLKLLLSEKKYSTTVLIKGIKWNFKNDGEGTIIIKSVPLNKRINPDVYLISRNNINTNWDIKFFRTVPRKNISSLMSFAKDREWQSSKETFPSAMLFVLKKMGASIPILGVIE